MLVLLDFKMNIPTPLDFVQLFLYLSDQSYDFTEIIQETMSLIYVSLMGKS